MTTYRDQDLESMLSDLESDLAERKESFKGDAPARAREAVCAFANDLPDHGRPSVVFIGARDDGSAAGLAVTDELLRQLADVKTDGNIVPPPTLTVAKHVLRGTEMAVVTVWPADFAARSIQGACLYSHRAPEGHRVAAGRAHPEREETSQGSPL